MNFATQYMAKHVQEGPLIPETPDLDLKYIVVIPAFNESGLLECLDSIYQCKRPMHSVEVITVINWPHDAGTKTIENNLRIADEAREWALRLNRKELKFHFITRGGKDEKNSGVGFARKTGMDEGIRRLLSANQLNGIILSLDADVRLENSYFIAAEEYFDHHPDSSGCNFYFEHPLSGDFEDEVYSAIAQYELYMRYYYQGLKFSTHPGVFHTVGSAFGVRATEYCRQGGMNKRQAGEDFYFLQKLFELGNFGECKHTRIFPSPRPSSRVPFGTGPEVAVYLESGSIKETYNPALFKCLKDFILISGNLYDSPQLQDLSFLDKLHPVLQSYLHEIDIREKLKEIRANSSSPSAFQKRFFRWFNMFRILKYLNFARKEITDLPLLEASIQLLEMKKIKIYEKVNTEKLLYIYRVLEKLD